MLSVSMETIAINFLIQNTADSCPDEIGDSDIPGEGKGVTTENGSQSMLRNKYSKIQSINLLSDYAPAFQ